MAGTQWRPKAIVFDIDTALIDRRRAWQYTVEEAVLTVANTRVDASSLVNEYHSRPWSHTASVLVDDPVLRERFAEICEQYFRRSALKRLLVFEGIGMVLDRLRGDRIEMGGITREAHADAMRQIESTGIDRFLAVLSPTNDNTWNPSLRFEECLAYLQRDVTETVFVTAHRHDAEPIAETGAPFVLAGWGQASVEVDAATHPSQLWPEGERRAVR